MLHRSSTRSSAPWRWATAVWIVVILGAATMVGALHKTWTPPHSGNRPDQCEALHLKPGTDSGVILEVQNTWSNAAYLLIGLLILACTRRPLGWSLGAGAVLLAVCSGLYHATLQDNSSHTVDARTLDVAAMYFVLWVLLAYAVEAVFAGHRLQPAVDWSMAAALALASYVTAIYRYDIWIFSSTPAVLILIGAITLVCFRQMLRHPMPAARFYLAAFAVAGGVAAFFRFSDGAGRRLCNPNAFIQPHAIWHVASAVLLLAAYDFFARSTKLSKWPDGPVF